jgi:hypothetical protein
LREGGWLNCPHFDTCIPAFSDSIFQSPGIAGHAHSGISTWLARDGADGQFLEVCARYPIDNVGPFSQGAPDRTEIFVIIDSDRLGRVPKIPLLYGKDVEIVGRVVAVSMSLES